MHKIGVIAGRNDPAGFGIAQALRTMPIAEAGISVHVTDKDILMYDGVEREADADLLIFASKHSSKEGRPTFSCHVAGNWGEAKSGGTSRELCVAPAIFLKSMFLALKECATWVPHEVTLEATHHGPFVKTPSLFVEIGSTEEEWGNEKNAKVVASAILQAVSSPPFPLIGAIPSLTIAVGLGGPHYCSQFNKIQLGERVAIGHVCPKHHLHLLDKQALAQAWERTTPKPDFFLLDWKGLGKEKQRIVGLLKESGFPFRRADEF